jgi:mono/diheme cytochrome c family protein
MKSYLGLAAMMVAGWMTGGAAARAQGFPDGPGKAIVQEACTVCHGSDLIANARRSKSDWTDTVEDMVSRGAPLKEGEREIVIEYLAANFGPEKAEVRGVKPAVVASAKKKLLVVSR